MNPILFATALTALVYRAFKGKRLTPLGIAAAVLTACLHGVHPWNLPFVLLITFYLLGTAATKVKHDVKVRLTVSSTGAPGGEGARTATQVFANSLVASALAALHALHMRESAEEEEVCFSGDVLVVGIIANYAAVTADTLSSELGILSRGGPRLITTLRRCPAGTNGGVSVTGLLAGAAGAVAIGAVAALLLPWCASWTLARRLWFVAFVAGVGVFGSLLDSLLGAVLQQSVVDVRTGKVVEAPGGGKVLVAPGRKALTVAGELRSRYGTAPQTAMEAVGEVGKSRRDQHDAERASRRVVSGYGVLSNNGVNFVMAGATSGIAMAAWKWGGF